MRRRRVRRERDSLRSWDEVVKAFEQRLGGVKIRDLEDGDKRAVRIAERSLRKEMMKLMSDDIQRREKT